MAQTTLLPPFTAVRLAWSLTGKFAKEAGSQEIAVLADQVLKDIKQRAGPPRIPAEQQYVDGAISTIQASLRSLDIIYKGRELNFKENDELRSIYLKTFKENLEFGTKAQDFLKSLPTMTIATGAGTVTLAKTVHLAAWQWLLVGLGLAGAGFIINQVVIRYTRGRQQDLYVRQDYERNLYYEQYVTRVRAALLSLYLDLDRIHANAFGQPYPLNPGQAGPDIVEEALRGIRGTACPYVDKHMLEKRVTPEFWPRCETGGAGARYCPIWEGAPPPSIPSG